MKVYKYPSDNIQKLYQTLEAHGFKVIGVNKSGQNIEVILDDTETKDPTMFIQDFLKEVSYEEREEIPIAVTPPGIPVEEIPYEKKEEIPVAATPPGIPIEEIS